MFKCIRSLAAIGVAVCLAFIATDAIASRNSSGTYTLYSPGNPAVTNQLISTSLWNNTFGDIATELSDSLSRSGKGGMTAPLRMADGAVSAPSFSYTSETGSGEYRIGAGDLGWAILGTKKLELTSALFTVTPALTVTGATTLSSTLAVTGASTLTGNVGVGGAPTNAFDVILAGSASTRASSLFEASLSDGNYVELTLGKSTGAGLRGMLTYTKNATAANSTICLGIDAASASTLCVDGNNKTYSNGSLTVGSSGTAISTLTTGTITLSGGSGTATVASGAKCVCGSNNLAVKCSVAATTLTATGTGTDLITYICT